MPFASQANRLRFSFWKQLPPNPGPACRNLGRNRRLFSKRVAAIGPEHLRHLAHVSARGLVAGGDAVDRADPLGQKGIGGELAELAHPEVGSQNPPESHPPTVGRRITSFVQGLLCCGCQKSFKIKARRKPLCGASELGQGHPAAGDLHVFAIASWYTIHTSSRPPQLDRPVEGRLLDAANDQCLPGEGDLGQQGLVGQRNDQGPHHPEHALAVLGADEPHCQPPRKLTAGPEIPEHLAPHLAWLGQGACGGVDAVW